MVASPQTSSGVRFDGRALVIGKERVPLYSGAVHYWRHERRHWKRVLEATRELGFRVIETYVPWGVHETPAGTFDFGSGDARKDLGAFLDLARELDLFVIVRPGPHINSELTYFGLPERLVYDERVQARSPSGRAVLQPFPPKMFPIPSYASDAYFEETDRWFEAVAEVVQPRLYPHGHVVVLQVDNEASFFFRDGTYEQDYHPDAVRIFRDFVLEKYGDASVAAKAHGRTYASRDDIAGPTKFSADDPRALHLDWEESREVVLERALVRFKSLLEKHGLTGVPTSHNLPLGDAGLPLRIPRVENVVDISGLDYYHATRDYEIVKRRTLYLAGTARFAYSPELGVGAPPWFTPLRHEDSFFTALTATAFGLRGFNLYMAVDRDRWYGGAIDSSGRARDTSHLWGKLVRGLIDIGFHDMTRKVPVAIVSPAEYGRLSRITSTLPLFSSSILEAVSGSPIAACLQDDLGHEDPIQLRAWQYTQRVATALDAVRVPYVFVDSDAPIERFNDYPLVVSANWKWADARRTALLEKLGKQARVVVGPAGLPGAERLEMNDLAAVERFAHRVALDHALGIAHHPQLDVVVHEHPNGSRVLFVINPTDHHIDDAGIEGFPIESARDLLRERSSSALPVGPRTCRVLYLDRQSTAPDVARSEDE